MFLSSFLVIILRHGRKEVFSPHPGHEGSNEIFTFLKAAYDLSFIQPALFFFFFSGVGCLLQIAWVVVVVVLEGMQSCFSRGAHFACHELFFQVVNGLRFIREFTAYPPHVQTQLARIGWYCK